MYNEPWARLIMSMMPNTRVSPAASKNNISPNCSPLSDCSRSKVAVMCAGQPKVQRAGILQSPT